MLKYHNFKMFDGAVLVSHNGKVVFQNAYGKTNREWNINNSVNTKFMIGSISKPLTATLALILVDKKKLHLDSTIDAYLSSFKNKPAAKVTIRQLLNHTSGIPNYDIIKDFFPRISRQNFTREEYIKIYNDSALAFKSGSKFSYSSWGYFTLGYILEAVSGKSYSQLMKDEIFDKIGMTNSGSYFHKQIVENRATGYDFNFGNYTSFDFRDQSNTMGTGDIYSTVEDLFKFHTALQNQTLLSKPLQEQMFTMGMPPNRYGFGWFNQNFKYTKTDSVFSNYHLGMTDGFISFMLRVPSTNSTVIILCNSSPTDFFGIVKNMLSILNNKEVNLKEPLHKKVENMLSSVSADEAIRQYNILKHDSANYYVDWISMTFLAENLLNEKRFEEAKIISENNVLEFPDKEFALVTMANIYAALNRKEDAIKYYKKTLEINNNHQEAKNRLKELSSAK